jgi:hypothetical protein
MRALAAAFVALPFLLGAAGSVAADDWHRRHDGWHDHWHGGWHDHESWRRGHWEHGDHDGRFGWWWHVGPSWFFYPRPVYPYPPLIATAPPPVYYWCDWPRGYYPYVTACHEPWRAVPGG